MGRNFRPARSLITAKSEPVRIDWANPTQKEAFEYGPYPQCLSGGYGAAKTFTACLKALLLSDIFPRNRGVIARRKWVDLQKTTMTTFFKLCPPEAYYYGRRSDQEKILRLNNGSEILWLHLDDPEQENVIQGIEINWFLIDQAEEVEEEIFDKLSARLGRWDETVIPRNVVDYYKELTGATHWPWFNYQTFKKLAPTYAMLTCNPDLLTHWIYRRFHPESPDHDDATMPDPETLNDEKPVKVSYKDLGYRMFIMDSLKNKHLSQQNRVQLLSRGQAFIDRYVHGKWGLVEGIIHTIPPVSILEPTDEVLSYVFLFGDCTFHRSYDHGDSAPACMGWWAIDRAGNHIVYCEYYAHNRIVSQHRRSIHDLQGLYHEVHGGPVRFVTSIADPSIFNKTQQNKGGRFSLADEYEDTSYDRETVLNFDRGDNDEFGTRNLINEMLAIDPEHKHPITGQLGAPRLYFVARRPYYPNGCDKLIQETESQRREKIGTYLGQPQFSDERDANVRDHAYDVVRYHVASRMSPFTRRNKRRIQGTFNGAVLLLKKLKRKKAGTMDRVARREAARYGRL